MFNVVRSGSGILQSLVVLFVVMGVMFGVRDVFLFTKNLFGDFLGLR